ISPGLNIPMVLTDIAPPTLRVRCKTITDAIRPTARLIPSGGVQYQLSKETRRFHHSMCFNGLHQRKHLRHDPLHLTLLHHFQEGSHVVGSAASHPHDRQGAGEDAPQMQFDAMARSHTTGDKAATGLQAFEAGIPHWGTNMFDDDIYPFATSKHPYPLQDVFTRVI